MHDERGEDWDELQWEKEFANWKEFHKVVFQMTNKDKKKEIDELFDAWRQILATFGMPPSCDELRIASLEMILDINLDIPWHRHIGFICAHVKWQRSPETRKLAELARKEGKTVQQITVEMVSEMRKNLFHH